MLNVKTSLILSPHADDAEFGCGGTIAKLVASGIRVHLLAFYDENEARADTLKAADTLQVEITVDCIPARNFPMYRQYILEKLIELKKEMNPDLVIQPSLSDIHQDHQTVAQEGVRAFKDTNLWGYEVPWNNLNFDAQLFVSLEDNHVETKIEAIKCYKDQARRPYANEDYIRSVMISRGMQVGVKNAEAFNVIRQVL